MSKIFNNMSTLVLLVACVIISTSQVYAEPFPTTPKTCRKSRGDMTSFMLIDGVNNRRTIPIDNAAPTVSAPRYSGSNYVIDVSSNKAVETQNFPQIGEVYLWKVVDANGTYIFPSETKVATVTRPSNGVSTITVYDHANNQTTVSVEITKPIISTPTYSKGEYIVTVKDPGEESGEGSGIWKITDNTGTSAIQSGVVKRPKTNGAETIYVYDNIGNVETLELTTSTPKVASAKKVTTGTTVELDVLDSVIELWKVTNEGGDIILANLCGNRCSVSFDVASYNARKIRVYNHAGNYTLVDLALYESPNYTKTKTFRLTPEQYPSNGIRIYDAVGNYISFPASDTIPPEIEGSVWTNATNTMFKVSATDNFGLGRIKDANGNILGKMSGNQDTVNFETSEALESFTVYDVAYNGVTVSQMSKDLEAPTAEIVYNNDVVTITAMDEESGIWKITDDAGDLVLMDYGKTFPSEATYQVSALNDSLRVYDGVGNYVNVDIKRVITGNAIISTNEPRGIKVMADCTIIFDADEDIQIGDATKGYPGIEIVAGNVVIQNDSQNDVSIYGGQNCAGIYVPSASTLTIMGEGTIKAYGGDGDGAGAGIGGNGITANAVDADISSSNAGIIRIMAGEVHAQGGEGQATGAGIGGGGIYNTELDNVSGGSLQAIEVLDAQVYAQGGEGQATGAGIGGGGIYSTITATITQGDIMAKHIEEYTKVSATKGTPQDENAYTGGNIGAGGIYNVDEGQHGYECLIDDDTTISNNVPSGLYIKEDANVTFEGELTIGDSNNMSEGIKIAPNKTLTMIITSNEPNAIKVKGGTYTNDNGDMYEYAGIYVSDNAKLSINQSAKGIFALQVIGNGRATAIGDNWVENAI